MSEPDRKKLRISTEEQILQYVSNLEVENDDLVTIDIDWLLSVTSKLKEKLAVNLDLRATYSQDPRKFAESEFELTRLIKELTNVTEADPPIYKEFFELLSDTLKALNEHPGDEVWESLRALYADILDIENPETSEDLIKFVINDKLNIMAMMLSKVFYEGNQSIPELDIIDKLVSIEHSALESYIIHNESFVAGLLSLIKHFDGLDNLEVQDIAIDILSKVVQIDEREFLQLYPTTVELLLIQLSRFRAASSPLNEAQVGFLDNLTLALRLLLGSRKGVSLFVENEGFELLVILLKNLKKSYGLCTFIKVLNPVLESDDDEMKISMALNVIRSNEFLKKLFKYFPSNSDQDLVYQFTNVLEKLLAFLPFETTERLRLVNKILDDKHLQTLDDLDSFFSAAVGSNYSYSDDGNYADRVWQGLGIVQNISTIKSWLLLEDSSIKDKLIKKSLVDVKKICAVLQSRQEELESLSEVVDDLYMKHNIETQLQTVKDLVHAL